MTSGEEYKLGEDIKPKEGLRISFCSGFLFAFLAIAIAVGVGLIVHFVEKTPEVTCNCSGPKMLSTENNQQGFMSLQQCKDKAKDLSNGICKACPGNPQAETDTKLPKTVRPIHYNIEMKPNMYGDDPESYTFDGTVKVTVTCLKATSDVIMNARDLDVTSVTISSNSTEPGAPSYKSHELDKATERLIIHLDGDLKVNQFYYIEMRFSGPLKDDMDGLYLSTYQRDGKPVYLATTQFESKSARKAFPCFDEPELKATFDVTLIRKKELITLSNMEIEKTETRDAEFEADIYHTSPIMSTYLVALIVSDFENVNGTTKRGLKFRVWSQRESTMLLHYALKVGETTISNYEAYFEIPFPLPKQDMVAIPDFAAGAMENWGCITYRAENLFYQEGVTSGRMKRHVLIDITHELAHQWFGDLVTMQWWDDTWLNEGFATFVSYIGADMMEPQWEMLSQMKTEELFPVFQSDALVSSHPIYTDQKVDLPFDSISYNKAGSVLSMLRFFIGEETFRKGVIRYLRPLKYGNANHNDLWKALHEQSQADAKTVDVVSVMRTWMEQMNYPVVTVSRTGPREIRVQQGRFTFDDPMDDPGTYTAPFNYTWSIPLTLTTSEEKNFNVTDRDILWVLHDADKDIYSTTQTIPDASDGWIMGNIQHHGFYRVNYDVSNWRNIIKQLKNDHTVIAPLNRAQVLNDAVDLGRAGLLDTRIGLEALEYLSKERNYFPWNAASSKLKFLDLMLRNTEIFGAFEDFVESISSEPFKFYTLDDQGANHIESQARREVAVTACSYSNADCLSDARQRFKSWQRNRNGNSISPELLETVLCTAIMQGEAEDWYFVYDAYISETSLSVKDDLVIALGCSQETWLMELFLQRATTPSITRKKDAAKVISKAIQNNPKLRSVAWNFMKENFVRLRDVLSVNTHYLTELIHSVADSFNTEFQLRELERFLNSTTDLGAGSRGFSQVLAGTRANIKWMKNNYQVVKKWLQDLGFYDRDPDSRKPPSSNDIFLPKTVKPIHYDLEMTPHMYEGEPSNFTYEGQVQILIQCLEPTNEIVLHSMTHTITSGSVKVEAEAKGDNLHYVSHTRTEDKNLLKIRVSKPLEVNKKYTISIGFTSPLKDDLAGFYLSSYKHKNQTRYLATTQMESESARKAFPCFDEPELKATFTITLVRRADFVSTSNMPMAKTVTRPNGYEADIFEPSRRMSTYLVAFIVCDFKHINGTTPKGLPFRVWAREDVLDQLSYAMSVATTVISYYEVYFNLSFPLPKQDMVAIPDFAMGAMENWGMITYREQDLLFKDGVTNNEAKQKVAIATAHELAHMWFGDLVTPKWWDDLWLNEGFATFVEYMGTDKAEPEFKMDEQFYVDEMMPVFTEDGLATSHPIYIDVKTMDEINEIFDDISYNKGGTVIRMLKFFLGEDTFQKGLSRYLRENQYSNADRNDLWTALDKQVEVEGKSVAVGDTMRTWTLQMNYPVVSVKIENSSSLVLKQQRFLFDPNSSNLASYTSPYNYKWNIPFTFTTDRQNNFAQTDADIVWIKKTDKSDIYNTEVTLPTSTAPNSWIVGNIGLYGLYRVQYEEQNWRALIKQLNTDHTKINRLNRGQIIYDAWDFAKSGMLSQDIAVQTVEYLNKETDYIPWKAAVEKLAVVGDMLQNTEIFGRFQNFLKDKSTSPFKKVGFNDTGSTQLESFARREITGVACDAGNTDCVFIARTLFQNWKTNNIPMYPELRKVILCTALKGGSPEDWFYVLDRYKAEKEIAVKDDILLTLGCTGHEWLIHTLMKKSVNPSEVSRADALRLLFAATENARAQPIVWNFVKDNWALIRDGFSENFYSFGKMIKGATRAFNTPSQLKEIEEFIAATPNLGVGERAFKQAVEQTRSNIAWMQKIYPSVKKWLEKA